ncbi:condensation domain-containing protein [Paludibacterium paludis]|uniref:Condensation domain-containing protein n=1 Tax=Paludibacterium paludis TaxID=1225769 RepID=A0A918U9X5_9NEIS|nr:condensation domain-containing protein [Paludibacterium paludis]GGY14774.1 hypothetical protein GCM10011289_17640 [Paludibacterium paludis]
MNTLLTPFPVATDRADGAPPDTVLPLGYAQLCFWFVYAALGETANNLSRTLLDGELDIQRLERAFNLLIERHDSLRASIPDWNPVQRIREHTPFDLPVQDVSTLDEAPRAAVIGKVSHALIASPFRLDEPPLLRARLFRLAPRQHLLLLCFPHIVADGGAVHLFERQLIECYEALFRGERRLPGRADTLQIGRFAVAERDRNRLCGAAAETFWRKRLAGHPYARFPERMLARGERILHSRYMAFPEGALAALTGLAHRHKATLQMGLIAVVGSAIHRVTGQARFTVNSVLENREEPGTDALMAPLLGVMPVPMAMEGGMTFDALLGRVREFVLEAYEHRDCPWSIPVGLLAEQRWRSSPRLRVAGVRAAGWLMARVFRKARLYPRFLADYLFMEPFPPKGWRRGDRTAFHGVPDPVINVNMLQSAFKRDTESEQNASGLKARPLNSPTQYTLDEECPGQWEDDTINIYIVDTGNGTPSLRVTCANLNAEGVAALLAALSDVLGYLSRNPHLPINLMDR